MADQLLFRGGNTSSVAGSTVNNREIVVDTQTNQIVLGSAKDRTVMERGTLYVNGNSVGVGISSPQTKIDSIGTIQARQLDDSKGVQISDDGGLELLETIVLVLLILKPPGPKISIVEFNKIIMV